MTNQEIFVREDAKPSFHNFRWSTQAIAEWEEVWGRLWRLGVMWEWQNGDRYARRRGEIFNIFAVHNDALRLDMAIPLPQPSAVHAMASWLMEAHVDDFEANDAINLIREWITNYVE